ncbi:MAG: MFS transporter [Planctomycetota bacterium]|nr:MFS transporter [Planctomycetota bacterium]
MNLPQLRHDKEPFSYQKARLANLLVVGDKVRPLLYATFFLFFGESIFITVLNLYLANSLALSYGWITIVFSVTMITGAVVSLPIGYMCDRIGRKPVLIIGFYFWLFGMSGIALFNSVGVILFFSALHGTGMAAVWTAFAPELTELTERRMQLRAFAMNFAMVFAGSVAGFLVGGVFPNIVPHIFGGEVSSYRITMLLGCLMLFPANRFLASLPKDYFSNAKYRILHAGRSERRRRFFTTIEVMIPYCLSGIAVGLTLPFINVYLKKVFLLSDHNIGFSLAAFAAVEGLVILLIPFLSKLTGRIALTSLALLVASPFLVLVGFVQSPLGTISLLVISVALVNLSIPLQLAFAMRRFASVMRGMISAEMATVWYGANGLGALFSLTVSRNEFELIGKSYLPAAVIAFCGGLLYWVFWRKRNREVPHAPHEHFALSRAASGRIPTVDDPATDSELDEESERRRE